MNFSEKKTIARRWLRFLFGGGINTAFSYGIFLGLNLVISYQLAYLIAYLIGVVFAYWFNAVIVFRVRLSWKGFFLYPLVYLIQYISSAVLLGILVEFVDVSEKIAPLIVTAGMAPVTYVMSKLVLRWGVTLKMVLKNIRMRSKGITIFMNSIKKITTIRRSLQTTLRMLIVILAMGFIFWLMPISQPTLNINLRSDTAGVSQLFLNSKQSYTEKSSIRESVHIGKNELRYSLSILTTPLRWDPLQKSATIKIYDIYITIFGLKIPSVELSLQPVYQIEKMNKNSGGSIIRISESANDPQMSVIFDSKAIQWMHVLICTIAGAIVSFLLLSMLHARKKLQNFFVAAEDAASRIINCLKSEELTFREIGILFAIGAISNIYFLANFSFSIDDEMAAVRENAKVWIGQGRWTVYLIEQLLFPQPAIPYAPYIVFIICSAVSYALITRSHGFPPNWRTYISYPLFCAFPTWWFIFEFYANIPAVGIGVLLVSLSIYLTYKSNRSDSLISPLSLGTCVAIVIFLAFATGAYQSLILLYLCISMGITLIRILHSNENSRTLLDKSTRQLFQVCLLATMSLMLYAAINYAAQQISGQHAAYINKFINVNYFIESPMRLINSVISEEWKIYSGKAAWFGTDMPMAAVFLVLATLVISFSAKEKVLPALLLWICILTIPFTLHFISGANGIPMRTMISLSYVTWLMGIILISQKRTLFFLFGTIIAGLYQLQIIGVTSQYMVSATITQSHDRILAADIYRRIGEISEDLDSNRPIQIDVYGHKSVNTVYANGITSTMQGSFFDWDQGNLERIVNYMNVMGYKNINAVETVNRQTMTPFFQDMLAWPAEGSVKKVGERYLIKLSQEPDRIHAPPGL